MKIKGINFCANCMNRTEGQKRCPHCGYQQKDVSTSTRHLPPGTVLAERYVLGTVLGQGNFGITYIAMDTLFESVIAVKECFPRNHVYRNVTEGTGHDVCLYEEENQADYEQMMEKFLDEAKRLTQFREVDGIVSVHDFFHENNTAYIVMEYVKGVSLKEYIEEHGPMKGGWVLPHMDLLMDALEQIHKTGLIHRDISPDNIIVTPEEKFELIDFGSVRETNAEIEKSLTVVFKRGFSPAEQYRSRGKQGVWTDVYAVCATIYFCLTGNVPDESLERIFVDEVPSLLMMNQVDLSRSQKKAIMKGISVNVKERYSSISELRKALQNEKGRGLFFKGTALRMVYAGGALIGMGALVFWGMGNMGEEGNTEDTAANIIPTERQPVSMAAINGEPSAKPPGSEVKEKTYKVPSVVGLHYKKAENILNKRTLKVTLKWVKSGKRKNTVVAQNIKDGTSVQEGKRIRLNISKGKPEKTRPPVSTRVPEAASTPRPTQAVKSKATKKPPKVNLDGMIN